MINIAMHSLGKWTLNDQAGIKRQLCFQGKYFDIYTSENRGLGFIRNNDYDTT